MYQILTVIATLSSTIHCASSCQIPSFDAREATIATVHHDLYHGLTTCRAVVSSFLTRIEAFNLRINAIITLDPNSLTIADSMDSALAGGNATGPLFCIPILLKDNYDTADVPASGGNFALAASQPSVDAPSVTALKNAGAIILGKANLHELALEGLTVSSAGGQTINPFDSTRTPGGSSGGSAAAVAGSFAVFATGTDTVNSLRSPASANSLFSIRPTRGLIARTGIIPISYTQDVIGPIGRSVDDIAVALTVMASTGYDPADNATALIPPSSRNVDYLAAIASPPPLLGLRFGFLEGLFNRTSSNETDPVNAAMNATTSFLTSAGATLVPISDPIYNVTAISMFDIQRFEYRTEMDRYLSRPSLLGTHPPSLEYLYRNTTKFLVIPSQYEYVTTALASSPQNATYATVQQSIAALTLHLQQTFAESNLDAVLYPEQKNLVIKIGAPSQSGRNGILAALTGSPVVTVPAGFSEPSETASRGIPIGMEILGRKGEESFLLGVAKRLELGWRVRKEPEWATEALETKNYPAVPSIIPDRGNASPNYPEGIF